MLVYLNGEYLPKSAAVIPVEDRGFIFGDGIYEVWRVIGGKLFEHERHFARLQRGLREMRIVAPVEASLRDLNAIGERLFAENNMTGGEGTLYMEITRGVAPRTHHFPPAGVKPTIYMMANPFTFASDLCARGATAVRVRDIRWDRCDIKTIQLVPNILAKQEAAEKNALEAIFVRDGVVVEGSHTNVMAVLNGELRTHPVNNRMLRGITRDVVLELARDMGVVVNEEAILESDLANVSELFLTGTTTDVMPIIRVDDLTIGLGEPGPVAKQLYSALRAHMDLVSAV